MALTEKQKIELRQKYNLQGSSGKTPTSSFGTETPEQRIQRLRGLTQAPPSTLQRVAQGLAGIVNSTGLPSAGVNAYNLTSSLGTLGAAGLSKLTGDDEQARRFVIQAGDEAIKVRNVPFLGETKPVLFGDSGNILKDAKDVVGTGLQIGTTLAGGGATKNLAGAGLRTIIKEGVKEGVKVGAVAGSAYEGGRALSEDKNALDVLQSFLVGGLGGATVGGALGATLPLVGAGIRGAGSTAQKVYRTGQEYADAAVQRAKNIRNPIPGAVDEPGILSGVVEKVRGGVSKAKGSLERSKINVQAQREARQAFESLTPESQNAIRKGLLPRDVELIKTGNASEKEIYKKIVGAAEDYAANRATTNRPSKVLGEEFSKRIKGLSSALDTATRELDDTVRGLGDAGLQSHETVNAVLQRLSGTNGLQGINITNAGKLDFTNTTLSGANSAAARKELQKIFDDVVQRANDAERLHLYRKELFEDLGGKTKSGIKLTATEEKAVNAMRQGMADAIETVAPAYKEANTKVATLLDTKKEIAKKFGEVAQGAEDIFDVKSSILLRRLTSNAKTGQDMAELIQVLEKTLGQYGIKFDTDLTRIQEFLNLLDRYYDIAPDTSLLGITRADAPKSKADIINKLVDIVGENFRATDDTAKQAIKDLLGR